MVRPFFAAVGARARYVDERHVRVLAHQRLRGGHGEFVGDVAVFGLFHACRRDAQAKEAGFVSGQLGGDGREVGEIGVRDLA